MSKFFKKENKEEKISEFKQSYNGYTLFAKFNAVAGLLILLFLVYQTIQSSSALNAKMDKIYEYSKNNVYSTILMTPNGIPLNVKKIPISPDADSFKIGIKRFMKNLIVDGVEITNGLQKKVLKAMDVYKGTKKLEVFFNNYVKRKDKLKQVSGFKSFTEYLNFLFILHKNDNLPETIKILSSTVSDYIVSGNSYTIEIKFRVYVESYIVEKDKNEEKIGEIVVKAKGEYDLKESSVENPYGNKIDKFSIQYVSKRPLDNDIYINSKEDWDILDMDGEKK